MAAAVVRVLKAERVRIWWWNNMGSYIKRKRNFFPVLLLLLSFISFLFFFFWYLVVHDPKVKIDQSTDGEFGYLIYELILCISC